MMKTAEIEYTPWRERAFVTIRQAADIMARSPDWVRSRISEGRLQARQLQAGGPLVVTVASLITYIDRVEARPPVRPKTPRIYLVIDNTN